MTQTANVITLEIGATVYNTEFDNFSRIGTVTERNGKVGVSFTHENGKPYFTERSLEKWQTLPENAPQSVLDTILDNPAPKAETSEDSKTETAKPETEKTELSESQTAEQTKLVKEFKQIEQKQDGLEFRKAEIIFEIRNGKLYTQNRFEDFAKEVLGLSREYALKLAAIGGFYSVAKETIDKAKMSINAVDQLIRNQNALQAQLDLSETELQDFAPVIAQVVSTTIDAAKASKQAITPRLVNTVNSQLTELVEKARNQKAGTNLIDFLTQNIEANKADILTKTKETLSSNTKDKKNGSNGNQSASNGTSEVYQGTLSALEIKCTLHSEFKGNKILSIQGDKIQTKCLCRFKMFGFDLIPYEIEGKRVKTA